MYTGLIANRYATALLEFAAENDEERRTYDEVRQLIGAYEKNRTIRSLLFSPVLPPKVKRNVIRKLFPEQMCQSLDKFVKLVIKHRRERYLYFMLYSFTGIYKRKHRIFDATLTTAAPVGNEIAERIAAVARKRTQGEVNIHMQTQPSLIGGFVFRLDYVLIDASLSSQLARVKRELAETPKRII
ncbi:ATP synthase F1 subunit delta [uncultured Alistipes sp.]|jgi:ATP synthase F1, delta subunit|uniref:ATP synthase F1 subunit delta n=1 Tax=uncultured Alistipes sp. TaxID=538949 RepID=UPI0025E0E4B1|nr:ATP synthase F1 subunit delta [uncultured Alistipes sp.]